MVTAVNELGLKRAGQEAVNSTKERVQIILGPKSIARLDVLKERMENPTRTEVIRNALRLFEAVIEELDRGREFFVKDEAGNLHPYKIFLE